MIDRPMTAAVTAVMAFSLTAPGATFSVAAQNRDSFDANKPVDGAVSAAACRPYGFILPVAGDGDDRTRYRLTPPPPSPPMPLSPPPAPARPRVVQTLPNGQTTLDGVVVTGSRVQRSEAAASGSTYAPPPVHRPLPPGIPPRPADTERYPDATPNPVKRVADEPVSTFSIDVDTAAYANVRRFVDEGRRPLVDAVRIEEMVNYFDYGYALPRSASEPFAITTAVVASPWSPGRQIVHIGLQGYELPEGERRPLNLTFLVDVSGSMNSTDKLALAQKSMNLIIDRLRPQDTVAVTYYAEGAGTTLAPTPGDQKLKLRCAVASLYASGGTAGATGMTNAYDQAQAGFARDKVNRILMFTDGDFNVGQTDNQRLEDYVASKRETGIYLSVYGFGRGNYQDARMQAISQAGNGTAAYVDNLNEARRLFGPAFDKGAFPIADDVKIQVEFNPARVSEYRLIGYETRLLNEEDFNNDRIDAGEVGSGASVTALYEITPVGGPSQIPERRYEANQSIGVGGGDPDGEVGFVQVRFKLPGGDTSRLIQRVLSNSDNGAGSPPESTRWALAVAAFGQKLRDDPWMDAGYGWDAILAQAQAARGEDAYGQRAELVQMVRAAQGLPAQARP
ncbi:von Willebrand factor type A domain-containing protein [Brevundimonas sp.]|uniref:vWA domain-containing protein n=1 Tax=Brevundimonas sp. TaxID=1871086 RepID=UPI0035691CD7